MFQNNIKNHRKGFTLLELLIYFAIVGIVGVVFVNILLLTLQSRAQLRARAEVQYNLRLIVLGLTREIRSAKHIESLLPARLLLLSPDGENTMRIIDKNSDVMSTTKDVELAAFSFQKLTTEAESAEGVRVNLTLRYRDNDVPYSQFSQNFVTSVYLRNHP